MFFIVTAGPSTISDTQIFQRRIRREYVYALAGWLSWSERHPIHQKVVGSNPSQATYLGCGLDTQSWRIWEATDPCFSLSLPFPLSLKSINVPLGGDKKEKRRREYV